MPQRTPQEIGLSEAFRQLTDIYDMDKGLAYSILQDSLPEGAFTCLERFGFSDWSFGVLWKTLRYATPGSTLEARLIEGLHVEDQLTDEEDLTRAEFWACVIGKSHPDGAINTLAREHLSKSLKTWDITRHCYDRLRRNDQDTAELEVRLLTKLTETATTWRHWLWIARTARQEKREEFYELACANLRKVKTEDSGEFYIAIARGDDDRIRLIALRRFLKAKPDSYAALWLERFKLTPNEQEKAFCWSKCLAQAINATGHANNARAVWDAPTRRRQALKGLRDHQSDARGWLSALDLMPDDDTPEIEQVIRTMIWDRALNTASTSIEWSKVARHALNHGRTATANKALHKAQRLAQTFEEFEEVYLLCLHEEVGPTGYRKKVHNPRYEQNRLGALKRMRELGTYDDWNGTYEMLPEDHLPELMNAAVLPNQLAQIHRRLRDTHLPEGMEWFKEKLLERLHATGPLLVKSLTPDPKPQTNTVMT